MIGIAYARRIILKVFYMEGHTMKIQQLSVFLENRPGQLNQALHVLANAGINIFTLSLADTPQFGILRLIVRDWRKAKQMLEEAGYVVNITDVVVINVPDQPGGMAGLTGIFEPARINIDYMYAFNNRRGENTATVAIRFNEPDAAIKLLKAHDYTMISSVDLDKMS